MSPAHLTMYVIPLLLFSLPIVCPAMPLTQSTERLVSDIHRTLPDASTGHSEPLSASASKGDNATTNSAFRRPSKDGGSVSASGASSDISEASDNRSLRNPNRRDGGRSNAGVEDSPRPPPAKAGGDKGVHSGDNPWQSFNDGNARGGDTSKHSPERGGDGGGGFDGRGGRHVNGDGEGYHYPKDSRRRGGGGRRGGKGKLSEDDGFDEPATSNSTKASEESDPGAVMYIIVVLVFYSTGVMVMIVRYLRTEKKELEEEVTLENFFKSMPDKRVEKEHRVNRMAIRAFHTLTSVSYDDEELEGLDLGSDTEGETHDRKSSDTTSSQPLLANDL